MKIPIAYLAGPLGFSEAGRMFHKQVLIPLIEEEGYEVRDPWVLTATASIDAVLAMPYGIKRKIAWQKLNDIIGKNNADAIRQSDLIIAVLDGPDVDSGTAAEIGFGAALGMKIIGYRGDFRLSSENEAAIVNIQVQYFVELNGGTMVKDIDELRAALKAYHDRF